MDGAGFCHGVSGGIAIVAIPEKDDYVWKISSEKIPHLTLMILGPVQNLDLVTKYVEHAAATSLSKFWLSVERRGTLGDKSADVLFFDKAMDQRIDDLRGYLLANEQISLAYNSVEQFDGWTPHLTLGYPNSPAKEDAREYPGFHGVNFDRLAVWTGQYEGPEFYLSYESGLVSPMAMSDTAATDEFLAHYGIKGMRWGVRRRDPSGVAPQSSDAVRAREAHAKLKKHGVDSLSNEELQTLLNRMNLEGQYAQKRPASKGEKATKFVADILVSVGKQQLSRVATDLAAKQVTNLLKRAI